MQDASLDKLGGLSHVLVLAGLISLRLGINNNNTGQNTFIQHRTELSQCVLYHATWGLTIIRTPQQTGLLFTQRESRDPETSLCDL